MAGASPIVVARVFRPATSRQAGVAQLVEQLIRNQQVRGSSPRAGSNFPRKLSINKTSDGLLRLGNLTSFLASLVWERPAP